jgi:hypothetical protein
MNYRCRRCCRCDALETPDSPVVALTAYNRAGAEFHVRYCPTCRDEALSFGSWIKVRTTK